MSVNDILTNEPAELLSPEAEEKRQEAVDDVGGAAGRQVQQAEARVNAAAKKAAARLEAATADTEKADEGGW